MRRGRDQQSLSYPLRLPDEVQADALRLLAVSREVINQVAMALWSRLDDFGARGDGPAYKQVEAMTAPPTFHGSRLWRCQAEMVGRLLRAQAERKKQFTLILPILEQGMIQPKTEARRAGKSRRTIREALADLRKANDDGGNAVELQSLIEQACNYYLINGYFPDTYEEMQAVPVLKMAQLPYAGDDGASEGQAFRMQIDLDQKQITLAFRFPDEDGKWSRSWRGKTMKLPLPDLVIRRLNSGEALAPTLREVQETDGTHYAVLDFIINVPVTEPAEWSDKASILGFDWGIRTLVTAATVDLDGHYVGRPFFLDTGNFDGRQARTRRQIDLLKAKIAKLEAHRDHFPTGDPKREPSMQQLAVLRRELSRCWRKYDARDRDLAHLAANILLLLATVQGCSLIAGESLKSLKSTGWGRDAKGRWRNWRNNVQIRGALWRVLRYKCHMIGIRLEWQQPRKTSHTCPACGEPANTYRSPTEREKKQDWGAWLWCDHCGWNGTRDYAAALNIARLGAHFIKHYLATGKFYHASIADPNVNPVSYIGAGPVLRLPPMVPRSHHLLYAGRIYLNGWKRSVTLHSSYPTKIMLRLCG
ncbi:MAG TPA: zinc ribbon domain-containing protein [Ktedonobacteraceae bacterium]